MAPIVCDSLIAQFEQPPRWKRANTRRAPACSLKASSTVISGEKCDWFIGWFPSLKRTPRPTGCTIEGPRAKERSTPVSRILYPQVGDDHLSGAHVTERLAAT